MATITQVLEHISSEILLLMEKLEVLEQKKDNTSRQARLKYFREQLELRISLFFLVMDNRTKYEKSFIKEELKKMSIFCKEFNDKLLELEKKED